MTDIQKQAIRRVKNCIKRILWFVDDDTPKEYVKTANGLLIGYRVGYYNLLQRLLYKMPLYTIEPAIAHLVRENKLVIRPSGNGRCFIISEELL